MEKCKACPVKKNERNWNDLTWKRKEKGDFTQSSQNRKRTAVERNLTDFFLCPPALIKYLTRYK